MATRRGTRRTRGEEMHNDQRWRAGRGERSDGATASEESGERCGAARHARDNYGDTHGTATRTAGGDNDNGQLARRRRRHWRTNRRDNCGARDGRRTNEWRGAGAAGDTGDEGQKTKRGRGTRDRRDTTWRPTETTRDTTRDTARDTQGGGCTRDTRDTSDTSGGAKRPRSKLRTQATPPPPRRKGRRRRQMRRDGVGEGADNSGRTDRRPRRGGADNTATRRHRRTERRGTRRARRKKRAERGGRQRTEQRATRDTERHGDTGGHRGEERDATQRRR